MYLNAETVTRELKNAARSAVLEAEATSAEARIGAEDALADELLRRARTIEEAANRYSAFVKAAAAYREASRALAEFAQGDPENGPDPDDREIYEEMARDVETAREALRSLDYRV